MTDVSRRAFLAGACSLVAMGGAALPAAASSAVRTLPDGRLAVKVASVPELASVGGAVRIGSVKGMPVGIARTGQRTYKAFSLRCPHQGVPVAISSSGWSCPAHGSQFELDGDLVLGPATKGLTKVRSSLRSGTLTVG